MVRRLPPVDDLRVTVCTVPTDAPEADGTLAWDSTTVVYVEAVAGGVTGLGWTYGPPACATVVQKTLAEVVRGWPAADVTGAFEAMRRSVRNAGRPGVVSMAISAVDTALWDLKARLLDVALCSLLGRVHPSVPVYGSGGFTTYDDDRTAEQLRSWVDAGIPRVKIKIGESWGNREERDLARVRLARDVVGPDVGVFVDANGAYSRKQAVRVAHAMAEQRVTWFEEPVSSDDVPGLAVVRDQVECDVAAGEYGYDLFDLARLTPVVDCLQADVTRCGGITAWLRVAPVAAAAGLDVSGHCAPALHAHVAGAVPNLRHLEYFHDHVRLESMLLDGTLEPRDGALHPDVDRPGNGLALRRSQVERYAVS